MTIVNLTYNCLECPSGYNTTDGGVTCNGKRQLLLTCWSDTSADIDECSFAGVCPGQLCVNFDGGYNCNNCSAGEIMVNGTCIGTYNTVVWRW